MKPALWGPALWQALFACAWACKPEQEAQLRDLVVRLLPALLPCKLCRDHFKDKRHEVSRQAKVEPHSASEVFRWLYYLKHEVNKTKRQKSISLDDFTLRYALHGPVVDDVLLGDALVLVAIDAHTRRLDDKFLELCAVLATLLPIAHDAELRRALLVSRRPIRAAAVHAAQAARVERGLPTLTENHYATIVDM